MTLWHFLLRFQDLRSHARHCCRTAVVARATFREAGLWRHRLLAFLRLSCNTTCHYFTTCHDFSQLFKTLSTDSCDFFATFLRLSKPVVLHCCRTVVVARATVREAGLWHHCFPKGPSGAVYSGFFTPASENIFKKSSECFKNVQSSCSMQLCSVAPQILNVLVSLF